MKVFILALLLSGCGVENLHEYTPEEQGAMIKRCEAVALDWHIFDRGRIICHKKEPKKCS